MHPIVHFEIIGKNPAKLREFYNDLFGWEADTDSPVAPEISEAGNYGFIPSISAPGETVAGGIGGGNAFKSHVIFYVGVQNVAHMLAKVESLGGKPVLGPVAKPGGELVVAHFADPEGNVVGLAGPN